MSRRIFGKQTIYKDIFRLEPGFKLNYDQKSGLRIKRYWSNFKKNNSIYSSNKNFENLNTMHLSANQLWQRSEVKISNTLSTGTDSNFINYGF